MAKTTLLIEMIDRLRNRPGVSVGELASGLNRSQRTIYRWLSELSVEVGAPVCCRNGGYYLEDERQAQTSSLSAEELVVLRMSLKSTPFAEGSPMRQRAESAWRKIRDAASTERLQAASDIGGGYSLRLTAPKGFVEPAITQTLENAIASRSRLRIVYRSQKSNQVKQYTIDPYALVFRRHSWYLLANCLEHGRVVQFKLVRFRDAVETGAQFQPPPDFSVDEHFKSSWEAWAGAEPVEVRVQFSPKVSVMVAEARRHPTQVTHTQPDGSIIFEATVAGIEEIAIWILGYGRDAEVLDPPELRDYVANHAAALAAIYAPTD